MIKYIGTVVILVLLNACIEPFDVSSEIPDDAPLLVVEATLTNEMKKHRVRLSRTRDFDVVNEVDSIYDPNYPPWLQNGELEFERNADVRIEDDMGNTFTFSESESGYYVSDLEFSAVQGVSYTLKVDTENGESYSSAPESYTSTSEIESVYVERDFNENGNEGVFVYVDGGSTDSNAKYFRYDYEESYKIVAPEWRPQDYLLTNYDPCALPVVTYDLEIILRDSLEQRVCYRTDPSEELKQATTLGLVEGKINRFPLRFINRNNYSISHRYSILVKQFAQSVDAYNYYSALNSFSASESIFSQVQPGFLEGNIGDSESSNDQVVLGYFEVASVSQQRIYFNYEDLFPDEPLPDYPISCHPTERQESHISYCDTTGSDTARPLSLIESVNSGLVAFYSSRPLYYSDGVIAPVRSWTTVPRACGDCTIFGNDEPPDFWKDE